MIAVGGVMVVIDTAYLPGSSRLLHELNDLGHIPLFGILGIALLHLLCGLTGNCGGRTSLCYALALVGGISLGVLSELIQYWGPRDADFTDLLKDSVGVVTALAIYASFDRRTRERGPLARPALRRLLRWGGVTTLLIAATPTILWAISFGDRNARFPVIYASDSYWSNRFVRATDAMFGRAGMDVTTDPSGESVTGMELQFAFGHYPGIVIMDVYPDWSGYDSLILVMHVPDSSDLALGLRIDDRKNNREYWDRFQATMELNPGTNRLAFSLDDIRRSPRNRAMDMTDVVALLVYGNPTVAGRRVLLEEIRLK